METLERSLRTPGPAAFLLHGVTGSGKTEVYLHAIAAALELRRGALVLVPEIALTPQLVARFRARFGDGLAVLHSGLSPVDRRMMWDQLWRRQVAVAIGARSALFAPVPDLGLLIVDADHDSSFKQEEGIRYNARDMAILRAHRCGAVCVLGSATPSLETEHLAREGRVTRLRLPGRARTASVLPKVDIIDLRKAERGRASRSRCTRPSRRPWRAGSR
jgi:primosomal protein N' (replication factor Y)